MRANSREEDILKHLIRNKFASQARKVTDNTQQYNLRMIAMDLGYWELADELRKKRPIQEKRIKVRK